MAKAKKIDDDQYAKVHELFNKHHMTKSAIAKRYGVHVTLIIKIIREVDESNGTKEAKTHTSS